MRNGRKNGKKECPDSSNAKNDSDTTDRILVLHSDKKMQTGYDEESVKSEMI